MISNFRPSIHHILTSLLILRSQASTWLDVNQVHDFVQYFDIHSSFHYSSQEQSELEQKIELALKEVPGFRPHNWKCTQSSAHAEVEVAAEVLRQQECALASQVALSMSESDGQSLVVDEKIQNFFDAEVLDTPCIICRSCADDENCLLCDGCELCMHTYCIDLSAISDGTWLCPWCTKNLPFKSQEVSRGVAFLLDLNCSFMSIFHS